jgi:transposase-like protein
MKNGKHQGAHVEQARLSPAQKSAIIAAVATGRSKSSVAKQFGVHRNTVSALCKPVQAVTNPANPLAKDYRETLRTKAVQAVEAGLDCAKDDYKRGGIGVKVLAGLGEFKDTHQVDGEIIVRLAGEYQPQIHDLGTTQDVVDVVIDCTDNETKLR